MLTREDMVYELALSASNNATGDDFVRIYLKNVTVATLRAVYLRDQLKYYTTLSDDDIEQQYKDYIDDEQMED